jgi:hypothetical protein
MATRAGALQLARPFVLAWWLAVAAAIALVLSAALVLSQAEPGGAERAPGPGVANTQSDPGFGDPYQPQKVGGTTCAQCR